jgi:carboxylate-amine ligase
MADYTRIWWDVRPHPTLGTLEIRIADQPTSLERTALLVRMLRDLVRDAPSARADRGDYLQNRWASAARGLDAVLLHPDGGRTATARELARELLGAQPPEPEALEQLRADDVTSDLVVRTLG